MMSTLLTLDTARRSDGKLVLIAAGEIDLSNIDAFDQALNTATTEAVGSGVTLTVDLSAVEYLDSAAINALFSRADHIDLIAHPVLMPVLAISGLIRTGHHRICPADCVNQCARRRAIGELKVLCALLYWLPTLVTSRFVHEGVALASFPGGPPSLDLEHPGGRVTFGRR